ncbi:hypothetical protein O9929_23310 [Vibrio lentus]|nr:hypothetical protein [Vibrio lentus]
MFQLKTMMLKTPLGSCSISIRNPAALQYLAPMRVVPWRILPYRGRCTDHLGDDLSKQAVAYRQTALLINVPTVVVFPARRIPTHSRLLERAARGAAEYVENSRMVK